MRALLLAATVAGALPISVQPASADPIYWDCGFVAFRDVTDEQGEETWIEATYSAFAGPPDTTQWEVTCWLQHEAEIMGPTFTTTPTTVHEFTGEIPNTRHTCSGVAPQVAGVCANPVIFEINSTTNVYFCVHVAWTSAITVNVDPGVIIDHAIGDIFHTGGITTMGGAADLVNTVTNAVNNAVATLEDQGVTVTPTIAHHTETVDFDDNVDGIQCSPVIQA